MFTIRYRDGIGRWDTTLIYAANEYEAAQIALSRGIWPYSVRPFYH